MQEAVLDARILLFAVLLTFASALIFGLAPAVRAGSIAPLRKFRTVGRGWTASQRLMAVQIGLSVVLLSG
ncbi:hypothetical protein, partial [Salmonella sp. SAL4458]|uniref:hypothetical protein n=1 Tax=Salmonella sp. SAL4458 TaxID=3159913 RepID=UPI00397B2355